MGPYGSKVSGNSKNTFDNKIEKIQICVCVKVSISFSLEIAEENVDHCIRVHGTTY